MREEEVVLVLPTRAYHTSHNLLVRLTNCLFCPRIDRHASCVCSPSFLR